MPNVFISFVALICLLGVPTVYAHKIKLFATAEGLQIQGYAYFVGGERIPHLPVTVQDKQGKLLGKTVTDAQGTFHYTATRPIEHQFNVQTIDGHQARYTLAATELQTTTNVSSTTVLPEDTLATSHSRTKQTHCDLAFENMLNHAIRPLREQLDAYQTKIWLHDIIGGIGYIFGIMGLILYLNQRGK